MRILVFGDSIARGSYDSEYGGWADRLSAFFSEKSIHEDDYFVTYNLGISAETAEQLADRLPNELSLRIANSEGEQVITLIQSGLNDAKYFLETNTNLVALEQFRESYRKIIKESKRQSDFVFCLGLTRVDESKTDPIPPRNRIAFRNEEIDRYDEVIKSLVSDETVTYINVSDLVSAAVLTPDGVHPNAEGHRLMYERVKQTLEAEGIL